MASPLANSTADHTAGHRKPCLSSRYTDCGAENLLGADRATQANKDGAESVQPDAARTALNHT